ncbi:MAG: hypothetical protein D6679_07610 [Candidatus Hydrogenedentota bacterium]|nr:MAG: hypothetical protein D6679_07610 [Candidatus Hydrogenedentota bacterium]
MRGPTLGPRAFLWFSALSPLSSSCFDREGSMGDIRTQDIRTQKPWREWKHRPGSAGILPVSPTRRWAEGIPSRGIG